MLFFSYFFLSQCSLPPVSLHAHALFSLQTDFRSQPLLDERINTKTALTCAHFSDIASPLPSVHFMYNGHLIWASNAHWWPILMIYIHYT